jgi:hypothetical protein
LEEWGPVYRQIMVEWHEQSKTLPRPLFFKPGSFDLSGKPLAGGGQANAHKVAYKGRVRCVKVFRFPRQTYPEIILWRSLAHDNILPLDGVYALAPERRIACVSPWMANGHVLDYLKKNPNANKLQLVRRGCCWRRILELITPVDDRCWRRALLPTFE